VIWLCLEDGGVTLLGKIELALLMTQQGLLQRLRRVHQLISHRGRFFLHGRGLSIVKLKACSSDANN
jgi:hypothetical protein